MGKDVDRLEFTRQDRARYRAKVQTNLDALTRMLAHSPFECDRPLTGLEDQTFCPLWSLMQGPCITIPAFKGPNGMPMGLQLVGPLNGDGRLLAVAQWVDALLRSHQA